MALLLRDAISRFEGGVSLNRMIRFLVGTVLLSSILALHAHAEGARRMGMNTTFHTFREDIKSIEELGVGTIRMPLEWQMVKIQPGEYDWSSTDRVVKMAQTKQIEVLFTIRTLFKEEVTKRKRRKWPIEVVPGRMNREEWAYFLESLANRYRGQGVNYEIENEVN